MATTANSTTAGPLGASPRWEEDDEEEYGPDIPDDERDELEDDQDDADEEEEEEDEEPGKFECSQHIIV